MILYCGPLMHAYSIALFLSVSVQLLQHGLYSSIDAGRATRGCAVTCRLLMMTEAKPLLEQCSFLVFFV